MYPPFSATITQLRFLSVLLFFMFSMSARGVRRGAATPPTPSARPPPAGAPTYKDRDETHLTDMLLKRSAQILFAFV